MDVTPGHGDDPESIDSEMPAGLDLTPRATSAPKGKNRWAGYVALGLVLVVGAVVLMNGLSSATTFFYNVDDAVAKKDDIGDNRVRIQGHAVSESIMARPNGVDFTLRFNGEAVAVAHSGAVPDLFDPEIPVVVEGRFEGDEFVSDRILVKHDETYEEDNSDRLKDAESDIEGDSEGASGNYREIA